MPMCGPPTAARRPRPSSCPRRRRSPSRPSLKSTMNDQTTTPAQAAAAKGVEAVKPTRLQAVRGMNDVLPDEAALWERFEDTARFVFGQYGYRNIRVPIVEPT